MAWFSVLCFVCVFFNHVLILCSLLCNGLYVHQFGEITHNRMHRFRIKNSKKKCFETKPLNVCMTMIIISIKIYRSVLHWAHRNVWKERRDKYNCVGLFWMQISWVFAPLQLAVYCHYCDWLWDIMNLIFSAQRAWDCLILQQVMDESYFSCHGIKSQWQVGICDILSWVWHLWHLWTKSMMANLRHT